MARSHRIPSKSDALLRSARRTNDDRLFDAVRTWRRLTRKEQHRIVREVVEARRSKSRPETGLVVTRQAVVNQDEETVLTMDAKMLVHARTDGSDEPR